MKIYQKLKPAELTYQSKWKFLPVKIQKRIERINNILAWIPFIYKDKDWDYYHLLRMLQFKIERMRIKLVQNGYHEVVWENNFWMTLTLNLLERECCGFYETELEEYREIQIFKPQSDIMNFTRNVTAFKININSENYKLYLDKHKATARKLIKFNPNLENDLEMLALLVSHQNRRRCYDLIFEILKRKSQLWWD